jgi:hypothetical protein
MLQSYGLVSYSKQEDLLLLGVIFPYFHFMKTYQLLTASDAWSIKKMRAKAEALMNEKVAEGYEINFVTFGYNMWMMPTLYITVSK